MSRLLRAFPFLAAGLLALAAPSLAEAEPGEELRVHVLTFGPGDHVVTRFGHNAIWIEDTEAHTDLVYNFGTFSFDSPWLVFDCMKSRLRYWLSVDSLPRTLRAYRKENRTVLAQELELTPAQRLALANALAENARGESRFYRYDPYLDNCSTRVRDAVDRVLGGLLREQTKGPARTFREHSLRMTALSIPLSLGLHVALGPFVDAPMTEWEELFLPDRLSAALKRATILTAEGPRSLVRSEKVLFAASRPPVGEQAPHWTRASLALGLVGGAALVLLGLLRRRWTRIVFATGLAVASGLAGVVGWVLVVFWAISEQVSTHRNENILLLGPWLIAMPLVAIGVARARPRALRWAKGLLSVSVASAAAALVFPGQENAEVVAFTLPLWVGAHVGVGLLARAASAPAPQGTVPEDQGTRP